MPMIQEQNAMEEELKSLAYEYNLCSYQHFNLYHTNLVFLMCNLNYEL